MKPHNQRSISQHERWWNKPPVEKLSGGLESLTVREREILESCTRYGSHKMVAADLGIAEQTIKNHISTIFQKLDVRTTVQACVMYDRWARGFYTWPNYERRQRGIERRSGKDRRKKTETAIDPSTSVNDTHRSEGNT